MLSVSQVVPYVQHSNLRSGRAQDGPVGRAPDVIGSLFPLFAGSFPSRRCEERGTDH